MPEMIPRSIYTAFYEAVCSAIDPSERVTLLSPDMIARHITNVREAAWAVVKEGEQSRSSNRWQYLLADAELIAALRRALEGTA